MAFRLSSAEFAPGLARAAKLGISIHEVARRAYLASVGIGEGFTQLDPLGGPRVVYDPVD